MYSSKVQSGTLSSRKNFLRRLATCWGWGWGYGVGLGFGVKVGMGLWLGLGSGPRSGSGLGLGILGYLGHRVRRRAGGDELGHITASVDRSRHGGHLRKAGG